MSSIANVLKLEGILAHHATGSRVICNPPVTDTDEDYVLLVDDIYAFWDDMELLGYLHTSEDYEADEKDPQYFQCWRRGEVNLIVTTKKEFYDKWVQATSLATERNLLSKIDRIALFTAVLYGDAEEVR